MSKRESSELDMRGYFLPEDSQLRLAKLGDHMGFLSRLAQPRTRDEEQEWVPEVRMGELAVCLELLAEQADLVLEEVSWPARRVAKRRPRDADPGEESVQDEADAEHGYIFGVTLDQIDTLNRLVDMISAHGDVVTAALDAELADHTLPLVGHAIFDGAQAVRDIIRLVNTQRLGSAPRARSSVSEERAVYGTRQAGPVGDERAYPLLGLHVTLPAGYAMRSPPLRPH